MKKTLNNTQLLIGGLAVVVVIGLGLLISRRVFDYGGLAFEILTYALSIVALLLAVLSVVNGLRQGRIMRSIVQDVHAELKQMASLNAKIEQDIHEDQEVKKAVANILARYGIDETEQIRKKVTKKTRKHIKKHQI